MKTTLLPRFASLVAAALCTLGAATPSLAEEVVLVPRHRAGDAYALTLQTNRDTDASWKRRDRNAFAESVRLDYTATVVVLDVDASGRPVRERHEAVRLTATRPDGTTSLFRDGASFEVRRDGDGIQVFAGDGRLERRSETIVAGLLGSRLELGVGPALFDPGRSVEVGESWELDPKLARRFLRARGVRAVELAGTPTATLERRADASGADALVLRYAIPIAWFEADDLPAHARATESTAQLTGEIPLAADGVATGHATTLALHMNGVVKAPGFAYATPWRFESARTSDQRTQILRRAYASGF